MISIPGSLSLSPLPRCTSQDPFIPSFSQGWSKKSRLQSVLGVRSFYVARKCLNLAAIMSLYCKSLDKKVEQHTDQDSGELSLVHQS